MDKKNLVSKLQSGIVKVDFTKLNGDSRIMRCTLETKRLPPAMTILFDTRPAIDPTLMESIAVWDMDKREWRSFRFDTVKSFEAE